MTEAYPLHWPAGWKRTAAHTRQRGRFHLKHEKSRSFTDAQGKVSTSTWQVKGDLTIPAAMRRLNDELDRLGARDVVVSSNVELRRDGQPRSDRRQPDDPGVAVYFTLAKKQRVLACDKWNRVPDNIAAVAGHIDAIRRQERYGVGTLDQAFAGYAALPPPGGHAKRPWHAVLGLDGGAELGEAEAAYREMAKRHHPDLGGDTAMFTEITTAIREARETLAAR